MPVFYGDDRGKSALGLEDKAYVDAQLLKKVSQSTIFDKFATIRRELPQRVGNTITFERRIPMFELMYFDQLNKKYALGWDQALGMDLQMILPKDEWQNFVLPEGSSGDEKGQMSSIEVEAGVIPIGMWRGHTEELKTFAKRWNLEREANEQGEIASQVIDGFYRDIYTSGATNAQDITTNAGNDRLISSEKFAEAVEKAILAMELQGAKPVINIIGSSPNYDTVPVKAAFRMYIPSVAKLEIRKNPKFVPVEKAGAGLDKMASFEFDENLEGFISGCAVYSTPKMYAEWDTNENLNKTDILIFGRDHTAQIPIRGKKRIEMIIKGLGESGDDRLNRVGSVGWKSWLGAKVLYPERLAKITTYFDV